MKKVWNIITTVLVVIVVIIALLLVGVRVFGLEPLIVLSPSMEPTYPTGSILYVKDVEKDELKEKVSITFMVDEDTLVTHRIIELVEDEENPSIIRYRTQGDANTAADGVLVSFENIVGTPVFHIPYLGYFSNFIQNPPGMYIAIAAACVLILLVFIPDLIWGKKEKE